MTTTDKAVLALALASGGEKRVKHAQARVTRYEERLLVRLRDDRFPGQAMSDVVRFLVLKAIAPYHAEAESASE